MTANEPTCVECGHVGDLNGYGRCPDCQNLFSESDTHSEVLSLSELVALVSAAGDADAVIGVLAGAQPPQERLEAMRWRESLLKAMKGKGISSPTKIADAWLRISAEADAVGEQADVLVQLVLSHHAVLFHSADEMAYAAVFVEGHRQLMTLRSRSFRRWIGRQYWEHAGAQAEADGLGALLGAAARVPRAQAVTDAIAVLEGMAVHAGGVLDVYVRVAHLGNKVYLDLGDAEWRAVEIDAKGWRIVTQPPVMFRRPPGMLALPEPVAGGDINELRPFVNVTDDEWPLLLGYIVSLYAAGPYPVLVLLGEQGCSKSTTARVTRRLVDPNSAELRRQPRSDHDLAIAANNSWVLSFDNLSAMPPWLSDMLCTIATGGGFSTRQLYSDDEERLFDAVRPAIINGIGDIATRSDLLDRAVLLNLPLLEAVKTEQEFWGDFAEAWPKLLGAVLEAVSGALGGLRDVTLDETPRMADFARWATAAEPALGLEDGTFLAAYLENRETADQAALENSAVGRFVITLAGDGVWSGSAAELLVKLNAMADLADGVTGQDVVGPTRRQPGWPKAPSALSNRLKNLAPNLRRRGIDIASRRTTRGSEITISTGRG